MRAPGAIWAHTLATHHCCCARGLITPWSTHPGPVRASVRASFFNASCDLLQFLNGLHDALEERDQRAAMARIAPSDREAALTEDKPPPKPKVRWQIWSCVQRGPLARRYGVRGKHQRHPREQPQARERSTAPLSAAPDGAAWPAKASSRIGFAVRAPHGCAP